MSKDETTYRTVAFDQSKYLDNKKNPLSAGGACHLFALHWCQEIISDKSLGAQDRMENMARFANAVKVQYGAFSRRWEREGSAVSDEGIAKQIGLKIAKLTYPNTLGEVAEAVKSEHREGFVHSFWFRKNNQDNGAHSIAYYRSGATFGGHIYVFDPNYGEYKMSKSQFVRWLDEVLTPLYKPFGKIDSHQLRYVERHIVKAVKGGTRVMPM